MTNQPVNLNQLVDELGFHMDEFCTYLNKKTGEFVTIPCELLSAIEDGDDDPDNYLAWAEECVLIAKDIIETEDYIEIPSGDEIDHYRIMEDFCCSLEDDRVREILCIAIQGKGAFSRFKDVIARYGSQDLWYQYRDEELKEIAIRWCNAKGIAYEYQPGKPSYGVILS